MGRQGIDGVFVKRRPDGSIEDVIVVESKFTSTSTVMRGYNEALEYLGNTKTMGRQMSDRWIDVNIQKMIRSSDASVQRTGQILQLNRSITRSKMNIMDNTGTNKWYEISL